MLKLMKLEMKKYNLKGFILGSLITMVAMFLLVLSIILATINDGSQPFLNEYKMLELIITLINDAYIIFAAVMLSKFIIGEYSEKTVNILFTYPIKRKKLIYAKILLVSIFMIISMIIANIFSLSLFYLINLNFEIYPTVFSYDFLKYAVLKVISFSVFFTAISSLSLYIGMIKKSQAATIVSSIIIVSVLGSSSNGFSLSGIVIIPLTVGLIGLLMTYVTFRNIEHKDI